jgi:hypothetical protein
VTRRTGSKVDSWLIFLQNACRPQVERTQYRPPTIEHPATTLLSLQADAGAGVGAGTRTSAGARARTRGRLTPQGEPQQPQIPQVLHSFHVLPPHLCTKNTCNQESKVAEARRSHLLVHLFTRTTDKGWSAREPVWENI